MELINKLGGVAVFGVVSICLFVVVFTASMCWTAFLRRPFLAKMETLPLEDERAPQPSPDNL
ncbi:MAG TPA: hypothetical protein VHB20_05580 [Verrucomicrobiae bacterium]|jgi:hypothetical protein|nr:hypothetical protein [Verrucomicrobiae bacterium]